MRDVSMTLCQIELALLGGLPLHKLDQLIASRCAPIYARPRSRTAACYTQHEAVMLATSMLLHERYSLGWTLVHHAIADLVPIGSALCPKPIVNGHSFLACPKHSFTGF